jgi:hypothetical protein
MACFSSSFFFSFELLLRNFLQKGNYFTLLSLVFSATKQILTYFMWINFSYGRTCLNFSSLFFHHFFFIEIQLASSAALQMRSGGARNNSTLVCAPVMADSVDKMVTNMDKAKREGADLVEIRLDSLKSFDPYEDLKTLIKECPLPTLVTYRFYNSEFFYDWILYALCVFVFKVRVILW